PRVLDYETLRVVADQRKRMTASLAGLRPRYARQSLVRGGNPARSLHLVPPFMHTCRNVDGTDLADRALHVDDRPPIDAVVDAEGTAESVLLPSFTRCLVRPVLVAAHAVLVPALQRPAATGALVPLAGPLVIA